MPVPGWMMPTCVREQGQKRQTAACRPCGPKRLSRGFHDSDRVAEAALVQLQANAHLEEACPKVDANHRRRGRVHQEEGEADGGPHVWPSAFSTHAVARDPVTRVAEAGEMQ